MNYPFKSELRTFSKDSIPSVSSCGWDHTQDDVRAPGLMFHHPAALSLTGSAAQSRKLFTTDPKHKYAFSLGSCREACFPGSVTVRVGPGCTPVGFFSPSVILKRVAVEASPTPLKLNLGSRCYRQTFHDLIRPFLEITTRGTLGGRCGPGRLTPTQRRLILIDQSVRRDIYCFMKHFGC